MWRIVRSFHIHNVADADSEWMQVIITELSFAVIALSEGSAEDLDRVEFSL